MGSTWLLRDLHGCYGIYVTVLGICSVLFRENRLAWLVRDRFTWECDRGIHSIILIATICNRHYKTRFGHCMKMLSKALSTVKQYPCMELHLFWSALHGFYCLPKSIRRWIGNWSAYMYTFVIESSTKYTSYSSTLLFFFIIDVTYSQYSALCLLL